MKRRSIQSNMLSKQLETPMTKYYCSEFGSSVNEPVEVKHEIDVDGVAYAIVKFTRYGALKPSLIESQFILDEPRQEVTEEVAKAMKDSISTLRESLKVKQLLEDSPEATVSSKV